ncbi:unnamed protein product [Amoebophrya sp. A25]|nr:unnamed protein product [Amoebophrya sp. A25]|eukprot:GSA25T00010351001.1
MQATGACWKDFWLPFGSEDNPKEAELAVAVPGTERTEEEEPEKTEPSENIEPGTFVRHRMRLGKQYTEDFLDLRIEDAVKEGASPRPPPFLVIHGTEDQAVPIREGKRLFEIAAEPKQFVEIPKGNHLLSNSKDMKKAMKEFVSFIAKL